MDTLDRLEAVWREALAAERRNPNARTIAAEQQAWDAYTEECDVRGICQQPGCDVNSPEWAFCPQHRE